MLDFLKNQAASFFVCFLLKCFENDDGQKVKFDVTDEQKEKIKEAIENSKSKQSQQDSAQAVSDMGAR